MLRACRPTTPCIGNPTFFSCQGSKWLEKKGLVLILHLPPFDTHPTRFGSVVSRPAFLFAVYAQKASAVFADEPKHEYLKTNEYIKPFRTAV